MLQLATPLLVSCLPTPGMQLGESGDWNGARFGRAVLALADIDGDGVRDLAVGAPTARGHAGRVLVLSGATREVLQVWQGEGERPTFGHTLCAVGDVDGDSFEDVLVGYDHVAQTEVRSGKDGSLLAAFDRVSEEVHPFGDFDGDGRHEVLLTCGTMWELRAAVGGGFVTSTSGAPELGRFHSVGDLNGDGLADGVLVADPTCLYRTTRKVQPSALWRNPIPYELHSPLTKIWGSAIGPLDGRLVRRAATIGDVDADGRADVLLTVQTPAQRRASQSGSVRLSVLSLAKSGEPLWSIERPLPSPGYEEFCTGYASAAPGDLDGDGHADLVIVEGIKAFTDRVSAFSLTLGGRLWEHVPELVNLQDMLASHSLASFADHDGDGAADVLVGTSHWLLSGPVPAGGTVELLSGRTGKPIWSVAEDCCAAVLCEPKEPK